MNMIKILHIVTACISISLFVVRGIWKFRGSALYQQRWVKIVPHINDSLLLLSAIGLSVMTQQYPVIQDWLSAKVIALVIYILLGMVAFRWAKQREYQVASWWAAIIVFAYIVGVALSRHPGSFFLL